ncbi:unnamed protein product [Amoebophrya sp. A25]|nr:unnamed protein product [Amoebophrya sp. A25]|eukprot:GSA25T00002809001.1
MLKLFLRNEVFLKFVEETSTQYHRTQGLSNVFVGGKFLKRYRLSGLDQIHLYNDFLSLVFQLLRCFSDAPLLQALFAAQQDGSAHASHAQLAYAEMDAAPTAGVVSMAGAQRVMRAGLLFDETSGEFVAEVIGNARKIVNMVDSVFGFEPLVVVQPRNGVLDGVAATSTGGVAFRAIDKSMHVEARNAARQKTGSPANQFSMMKASSSTSVMRSPTRNNYQQCSVFGNATTAVQQTAAAGNMAGAAGFHTLSSSGNAATPTSLSGGPSSSLGTRRRGGSGTITSPLQSRARSPRLHAGTPSVDMSGAGGPVLSTVSGMGGVGGVGRAWSPLGSVVSPSVRTPGSVFSEHEMSDPLRPAAMTQTRPVHAVVGSGFDRLLGPRERSDADREGSGPAAGTSSGFLSRVYGAFFGSSNGSASSSTQDRGRERTSTSTISGAATTPPSSRSPGSTTGAMMASSTTIETQSGKSPRSSSESKKNSVQNDTAGGSASSHPGSKSPGNGASSSSKAKHGGPDQHLRNLHLVPAKLYNIFPRLKHRLRHDTPSWIGLFQPPELLSEAANGSESLQLALLNGNASNALLPSGSATSLAQLDGQSRSILRDPDSPSQRTQRKYSALAQSEADERSLSVAERFLLTERRRRVLQSCGADIERAAFGASDQVTRDRTASQILEDTAGKFAESPNDSHFARVAEEAGNRRFPPLGVPGYNNSVRGWSTVYDDRTAGGIGGPVPSITIDTAHLDQNGGGFSSSMGKGPHGYNRHSTNSALDRDLPKLDFTGLAEVGSGHGGYYPPEFYRESELVIRRQLAQKILDNGGDLSREEHNFVRNFDHATSRGGGMTMEMLGGDAGNMHMLQPATRRKGYNRGHEHVVYRGNQWGKPVGSFENATLLAILRYLALLIGGRSSEGNGYGHSSTAAGFARGRGGSTTTSTTSRGQHQHLSDTGTSRSATSRNNDEPSILIKESAENPNQIGTLGGAAGGARIFAPSTGRAGFRNDLPAVEWPRYLADLRLVSLLGFLYAVGFLLWLGREESR